MLSKRERKRAMNQLRKKNKLIRKKKQLCSFEIVTDFSIVVLTRRIFFFTFLRSKSK